MSSKDFFKKHNSLEILNNTSIKIFRNCITLSNQQPFQLAGFGVIITSNANMPSTELYVASIDEYHAKIKEFSNLRTFALFGGSTDESTGESWSADCRNAERVIEKGLEICQDDAVFLYVEIGNEAAWNDPGNAFRKDSSVQLNVLPTLIELNTAKRLEGADCLNVEAVAKFFS